MLGNYDEKAASQLQADSEQPESRGNSPPLGLLEEQFIQTNHIEVGHLNPPTQQAQDNPGINGPNNNRLEPDSEEAFSQIEDVRIAQEFIAALRKANLENGDLDQSQLDSIRNPPESEINLDEEEDKFLLLSLRLFLAQINSSQKTYDKTIHAIRIAHPEDELLSFDQIKRRIALLTGVHAIIKDMCPNTCIAYTGPFEELEICPRCGETRIDPLTKKPRQKFYTLPIGPVIQAMKRDKQTSGKMENFNKKTKVALEEFLRTGSVYTLDDICCGTDILQQIHEGKITKDDTVLMMSFDGAQLYRNKVSDCWIYIWIFVGISPCERYKKHFVIPGGFIPGPHKPKVVESFLYTGLHHVAALNRCGGLPVWDALRDNKLYRSYLFILLATADGPGMTYLNGLVGHSGKIGCRLWCGLVGRHKQGGSHYYPVLFKPHDYHVTGCDHADVNPAEPRTIDPARYSTNLKKVCESRTQARYEENRRETGICKPSIFSGLDHILGIPNMFPGDIMHLILNLADILMNLWRGTLDCASTDSRELWTWAVLQGDTWKFHGIDVAAATPHLPGSFDRPPRNPAEKINSGYKAWEFLLYLFGLGPGLFYKILPDEIWTSYCRLVSGIRIMYQKKITADQYKVAHKNLIIFTVEFEKFYVQRRKDRIHFVRQSIHALSHMVPEAIRAGPGACSSQWAMERSIGNLTEEIKQHSKVYTHLSERGLRRASINALKASVPSLDKDRGELEKVPQGGKSLGDGYILLRAMDSGILRLDQLETTALKQYLMKHRDDLPEEWCAEIIRWSRLRLPNGQVARSAWKEDPKGMQNVRTAKMVKLPNLCGKLSFGEVRYYFQYRIYADDSDVVKTLAMISLFGPPDVTLLRASSDTLWSCQSLGDLGLMVVDAKEITSVVAMVPHSTHTLGDDWSGRFFVVEKPGLDVAEMGGVVEDAPDED
ncbi:hypothetical protein B0H34DRAFT_753304 [Crassisporium funariophilum]|nr:hypothetical protein B0H34DRAFT_753304 [Crassisporium funariophilum]